MNPIHLPVNRPKLPTAQRLADYISMLDNSRQYSNFGKMHEDLRGLLAKLFEMNECSVGLASSGTAALSALLQAVSGRAAGSRRLCVCPAFTFVATASAAVEAGYIPYIADVNPETWALDPDTVLQLPLFRDVGAVIVTAPLGRMINLKAWQMFSDHSGVPVIVDAAAGFDSLDPAELRSVRLPIMLSLHATKTFSTCEGGLMLCHDETIINRAMAAINFGFDGSRISTYHGVNSKMSEYHALIGLAELDGWSAKRDGFRHAGAEYLKHAKRLGLDGQVFASSDHAVPYAHFLAETEEQARHVTDALDAELIGWRYWYGMGLRSHPAFREYPADVLHQTKMLAPRLIGLPMAVDLRSEDVYRTLKTIRNVGFAGL